MLTRLLRLTLILIALAAVLLPRSAGAENAVTFTNAQAEPGGSVTIDVVIENDFVLGGLFIPFRWSSPDLRFRSLEFVPERWDGTMTSLSRDVDHVDRTGGLLLSPSFNQSESGNVPVGTGPVARLHFDVLSEASDQIVFIDSALIMLDGFVIAQVQYTDQEGIITVFPSVHPGAITIGSPPAVEIIASPTELFLTGVLDGFDAEAGLSITSTGTDVGWSASWNSLWLNVAPSLGKTPAFPTVSADLFGLDIGDYLDTIRITSDIAENSPISVPVTLHIDSAAPPQPPRGFDLFQNRPNPFVTYSDPQTEIQYTVDERTDVSIRIYDTLGRMVRSLVSRSAPAGVHEVGWDGRDNEGRRVASGHYFYRMVTPRGSMTKRLIFIK